MASWKNGRVGRWQYGKGGRVVRWQGGRFLGFNQAWGCRVSLKFHLFVSNVSEQNEGAQCAQDFLAWP